MKTTLIALLLASSAFLQPLIAQGCPYSVSFTSYGSNCTTSGFQAPDLRGAFRSTPTGCSLEIALSTVPGCCNTFITGSLALAGLQSAQIPIFRQCDLLVLPVLSLPLLPIPGTSGVYMNDIPLPPSPMLIGLDLYFQALVVRFTTIGMTTDLDFTQGVQASFR